MAEKESLNHNPFVYGAAATGRAFIDRKAELSGLARDLAQQSRIFLISPRRYGKTSLMLRVLEDLRSQGLITVYLDFYQAASLEQFSSLYARALARSAESGLDAAVRIIQEIFRGLRPEVSVNALGELSVSFGLSSSPLSRLEQVLDAAQSLSRRKEKRVVVAFDEFQEVRTLGGEALEKSMRSLLQHHHDVSYLFAGSKRDAMVQMTSDKNKAFYRMGKVEFLAKIPSKDFLEFMEGRFSGTKRPLEQGASEAILDAAEGVPYFVQYLCHELWNETPAGVSVSVDAVSRTLAGIVDSHGPIYLTLWENLTLLQRRFLQALSTAPKSEIFSTEFLRKYDLGSPGSVQTAIRGLTNKDLLDREDGSYAFSDVWFGLWVRKTLGAGR